MKKVFFLLAMIFTISLSAQTEFPGQKEAAQKCEQAVDYLWSTITPVQQHQAQPVYVAVKETEVKAPVSQPTVQPVVIIPTENYSTYGMINNWPPLWFVPRTTHK